MPAKGKRPAGEWKGNNKGKRARNNNHHQKSQQPKSTVSPTNDDIDALLNNAYDDDDGDNYVDGTNGRKNDIFELYYRQQGIIEPAEWDDFISTLQRRLPVTFRLSSINGMHQRLQNMLTNDEFKLKSADPSTMFGDDGLAVAPPSPLAWYPGGMAWYVPVGKSELKRVPGLAPFRQWLMAEFDSGNLNRQEAVSMIPTLVLDVQPHHVTLDICAAPGSKTAQILDDLHGGGVASNQSMVIANDADSKRAFMLVHQLKRLGSPSFLVTAHEGQNFPNLYTVDNKLVEFDRILADVPCSGDGTLRKNLKLWGTWTPAFAFGLHTLQLNIALRGLAMLKVGGLMVYSTCALNPIEDEAVVAELLRQSDGAIELVDITDKLPELKRALGRPKWKVIDTTGTEVEFTDEIRNGDHPKMSRSMFPPTAEEAAKFNLDRTWKILPHHQDTGGFFVALIRKTRAWAPQQITSNKDKAAAKAEAAKSAPVDATPVVADAPVEESKSEAPVVQQPAVVEEQQVVVADQRRRNNEDAFEPMNVEVAQHIIDFFGLRGIDSTNFFARSSSNKKIYFVAPAIASILRQPRNSRLRVIHTGSRCFEKNHQKSKTDTSEYHCEYRVVQEGIDAIWPLMNKQLLEPEFPDFLSLLIKDAVLIKHLSHRTDKFAVDLNSVQPGCVVLLVKGPKVAALTQGTLALAAWKTTHSISLMIPSQEKKSLLNLINRHNTGKQSTATTTTAATPVVAASTEQTTETAAPVAMETETKSS